MTYYLIFEDNDKTKVQYLKNYAGYFLSKKKKKKSEKFHY